MFEGTDKTSVECLRALAASAVFLDTGEPSSPGSNRVARAVISASTGQVNWRSWKRAVVRGLLMRERDCEKEKAVVITRGISAVGSLEDISL